MADDGLHIYGFEGTEDTAVPLTDAVAAGLVKAPVPVEGATTPLRVTDYVAAALPAAAFGIVGDAVIAGNGTLASGTEQSGKCAAYHLWCYQRGVRPNYAGIDRVHVRAATVPIYGPGDYPIWVAPNAAVVGAVVEVAPVPSDVTQVPLSEVKGWTNVVEGASVIGGLSASRKGQYITVDTADQKLIGRGATDTYRVGQGFFVVDGFSRIAPALITTWDTLSWTDGGTGVYAQTVRERICVEGLRVYLYQPKAGDGLTVSPRERVIAVTRCNTTSRGHTIKNFSSTAISQGLVAERCGLLSLHDISVTGLGITSTNYGISLGLTAEVDVVGSSSSDSRRSVDQFRSINVRYWGGSYLDGMGGHWAVGTQILGATFGPLHYAGRDISVIGGRQYLDGRKDGTARAFNIRADSFEFGGTVFLGGGLTIDIDPTAITEDPIIVSCVGPNATYDTLRPVKMPSNIVVDETVTVRLRGSAPTRNVKLLHLLKAYDAGMVQPILTSGRIRLAPQVIYDDGILINSSDGRPRTRIEVTNPAQKAGNGYDITVREPAGGLFALMVLAPGVPVTATPRHDLTIERCTGPIALTLTAGAYRRIRAVNCVSRPVVTIASYGAGFVPIGDESVDASTDPVNPLDASPVQPTISIRFLSGLTLGSGIFSRASAAAYIDARGALVTVPADMPRLPSDATTGAPRGLLIEGAGVNLLSAPASPATQTVSLPASMYTLSVMGAGSATLSGGATGTATQGSPVTFTIGATTNVTVTVSGTLTGFQLETGTLATSLILAGTRAADVYAYALPANAWNANEGTIVLDAYAAVGVSGPTQQAVEFGDGSANNRILLQRDTSRNLGLALVVGGTNYPLILGVPWADGARLRVVVAVGAGTVAVSVNGGPVITASAPGLPPATQMRVGDSLIANRPFNGTILSVDYIPRRVANTALPSMSIPASQGTYGALAKLLSDKAPASFAIYADKAVPVPLDLRASVTKSIYDYGLARGATDITAALAEVRKATDSPVVLLPEGTFTVTAPDTTQYFASNVVIRGARRGRTTIKLVGASLKKPLFAWTRATGVGLSDLTIDVNGVRADPAAFDPLNPFLAYIVATDDVRGFSFDNVEITGMLGDKVVGLFALKTQHARVRNSRFAFTDNPRGATGGILADNSFYGSANRGKIADRVMTITTFGGNTQSAGLYAGQHFVGKGVPLNAYILGQLTSTVKDASGNPAKDANGNPIMGREGTYQISHAATVPDNTQIDGVSNDDWEVSGTEFRNCILSFQATRAVSRSNHFNGWGSGSAIIFDYRSAGGKSTGDRFNDGNMQPDGTYRSDENLIWGDALEVHGDFVEITNPNAENVAGSLIGGTSDNWRLIGGRIRKFAQASIHDTGITATTSGTTLTVSAVAAAQGLVIKGQTITGPGIPSGTRIQSENGSNTYTLSKSVTAPTTNGTFSVVAPIVGAAINIQQADTLGTSAGAKISGVDIIGSGTPGEKYGVYDQDGITGAGAIVSDMTITGVSIAPYRIVGKTVIVDPGARLSPTQLAAIAPNAGTAVGVAGVGLTSAGVVSGSGSTAAVVFGDGTKFAVPVVPTTAPTPWTEYAPTFSPTPAFTTGAISLNRASYTIVGKILSIQMRFTLPAGGGTPSYMNISLPSGVTTKDVGAGSFKNLGNGAGGFVHNNNPTTLQLDNKSVLTDGAQVALSGTFELP